MLTISTPARVFERFVADISAANASGSAADAQAVFARHGFELFQASKLSSGDSDPEPAKRVCR